MTTWISSANLKQSLANMLHVPVAQLGPEWDTIVQESNQSAFLDVRGLLIQRGFTATQVLGWDRGPEFQRDIGLFWCLVKGAGLHNYDDRFIGKLDRRKEIKDPGLLVEINGVTTQMAAEPMPVRAGGLRPAAISGAHWGAVCNWGWPGCDFDLDDIPPYPRGTGRIA